MKTKINSIVLIVALTIMSIGAKAQGFAICVAGTVTPTCAAAITSTGSGVWSSSNAAVASVNSTGIITGVSAGIASISYTFTSCVNGFIVVPVTVDALPAITGTTTVCNLGSTTLTGTPTGGTWTNSTGFVSVGSGSGIVTGLGLGTDVVTYSLNNACGFNIATTTVFSTGTAGNIFTIAGTGVNGWSGDGGLAILATMKGPRAMAADAAGNIYYNDPNSQIIRKIATNGVISTFAGTPGVTGASGDGGPATSATLNLIGGGGGICFDNNGDMLIAVTQSHVIRKIDMSTNIITKIAGQYGSAGSGGDGGPATATATKFNLPIGIRCDNAGNIYITDGGNHKIRKINASGIISTFAGTGTAGYSGDGGAATAAAISYPKDVELDKLGNVYISEGLTTGRVRKVNTSGTISTIAGNGSGVYNGDGGPATAAGMTSIGKLAYDGKDNIYLSEQNPTFLIRKIDISGGSVGNIDLVAGIAGVSGFSGDGGPATLAKISGVAGLVVGPDGNIYIADGNNLRIREILMQKIKGYDTVCLGSGYTTTLTCGSIGGTWSSSNTSIATVSSAGVVTGVALGSVTISYTVCGSVSTFLMEVASCSMSHRPSAAPATEIRNQIQDNLSVIPNPTKGTVMINGTLSGSSDLNMANIDVIDISGRIIYTGQEKTENGVINTSVDLGKNIPNGTYLIRVRNNNESKVTKVVLEH